jgi:hypothetical protein
VPCRFYSTTWGVGSGRARAAGAHPTFALRPTKLPTPWTPAPARSDPLTRRRSRPDRAPYPAFREMGLRSRRFTSRRACQRSQSVCRPSQNSALMPSTRLSLTAVSAVTALLLQDLIHTSHRDAHALAQFALRDSKRHEKLLTQHLTRRRWRAMTGQADSGSFCSCHDVGSTNCSAGWSGSCPIRTLRSATYSARHERVRVNPPAPRA